MMSPDEYLHQVLKQQTLDVDGAELKALRNRRDAIKDLLQGHFSEVELSLRNAGSLAKGTMIAESYDGDLTCYFPHVMNGGPSLETLYQDVALVLEGPYEVKRKTSALRVMDPSTRHLKGIAEDLHIDVVPGRFTDETRGDVFLHQTTGEKERLKTNLDTHIAHIRGSGVRDAIRLMKYWNVRNGIGAKTFVLELLVVKLLENRKHEPLSTQLIHVWTEFRDNHERLSVEDPANPFGNDLKPALDLFRTALSSVAGKTLRLVEIQAWELVFGETDGGGGESTAALRAVAASVRDSRGGTRPWCPLP